MKFPELFPIPALNLSPRFSLRAALTVPYVLLTIVLAVTIGMVSYWAGLGAVEQLSDRLLTDIVQRVSQAVDRHLVGSRVALEAVVPKSVGAQLGSLPGLDEIERRLTVATTLHTNPNNYVYYANQSGQFVGVNRLDDSTVELRHKATSQEPRRFFQISESGNSRSLMRVETTIYEPRQRPWYKQALEAKRPIWAPAYVDYSSGDLVTTRAHPVFNQKKLIEGVVATDVSLKKLSQFVGGLKLTANGVAFIVDSGGNLIASSTGEALFRLDGSMKRRVLASESTSELVRTTYSQFAASLKATTRVEMPHTTRFKTSMGVVSAAVDDVRDDAGLDWFTLIAVPQSDFTAGLSGSLARAVLVGFTAAGIAVLVGLWTLNWVTRDLRLLTAATKRISDGHIGESLAIFRHDEIGELARSFEKMHVDLQVDELTGVYNRETFVRLLERTIREANDTHIDNASAHKQAIQNFSVLFIDINKFKAINDDFGHPGGDKMLRAVADRLRQAVRAGDIVARYGGDEFVVLLKGIGQPVTAKVIAEKIAEEMNQSVDGLTAIDGGPVCASVSIGVAMFPRDGNSVDELIRLADKRMYSQKRQSSI
jgi:diguanylate cyclase (GGDEF)-like protein